MKTDAYTQYLNSASWKITRNRRLALAKYRCERCQNKRQLQVHHLTYERLGSEWDSDLEVLCIDCHERHHLHEMQDTSHRIYLALASAVLRERPFDDVGELAEEVKRRCVLLGMTYSAHQIDKAIGILSGTNRIKSRPIPQTREDVEAAHGRPLNAYEARETLKRLNLGELIRQIPSSPPSLIDIDAPVPREQVDHDRY